MANWDTIQTSYYKQPFYYGYPILPLLQQLFSNNRYQWEYQIYFLGYVDLYHLIVDLS